MKKLENESGGPANYVGQIWTIRNQSTAGKAPKLRYSGHVRFCQRFCDAFARLIDQWRSKLDYRLWTLLQAIFERLIHSRRIAKIHDTQIDGQGFCSGAIASS